MTPSKQKPTGPLDGEWIRERRLRRAASDERRFRRAAKADLRLHDLAERQGREGFTFNDLAYAATDGRPVRVSEAAVALAKARSSGYLVDMPDAEPGLPLGTRRYRITRRASNPSS